MYFNKFADEDGFLDSPDSSTPAAVYYYEDNKTIKLIIYAKNGVLWNPPFNNEPLFETIVTKNGKTKTKITYNGKPAVRSYYPDGEKKAEIWIHKGNFVLAYKQPNFIFRISEDNEITGWCTPFPEPISRLVKNKNYENLDEMLYSSIASGKAL